MSRSSYEHSLDINGENEPTEKGFLISSSSFMYIPTQWTVFLTIGVLLTFEAFIFIYWPSETPTTEFYLRSTIHVGIFVYIIFINRFINFYHRKALRHGYINLYRRSKLVIRVPPATMAIGTAVLLLWLDWASTWSENLMRGMQIIYSVELVFLIPSIVYYGVLTWRHNSARSPPDGTKELASDLRLSLYTRSDPDLSTDTYLKEVADRQTETIRYLQLQKENLSKQVVNLNERLQQYEHHGAGKIATDDMPAFIESKEQEIRALKGNINDLESLLRQAREERQKEEAIVQDRQAAEEEKSRLQAEIKKKIQENSSLQLRYAVEQDKVAAHEQSIAQLNVEITNLRQQLTNVYQSISQPK